MQTWLRSWCEEFMQMLSSRRGVISKKSISLETVFFPLHIVRHGTGEWGIEHTLEHTLHLSISDLEMEDSLAKRHDNSGLAADIAFFFCTFAGLQYKIRPRVPFASDGFDIAW